MADPDGGKSGVQVAVASDEVGSLYSTHADWLRRWLQQRTRCSHRAADLTQDTFRRLLEKRPAAPIDDPRNYLATVARRLLIDDTRRRSVEAVYLDAYALLHGDGHVPSPERIAEAIDLVDAIMRLVSGLSDKARRSFLMIRLDGRRYADVAVELGISERMVKRYVAQAYAHCYAVAYAG